MDSTYQPEREYIVSVLLREFLGLDYRIDYQNRADIQISDGDGRCLRLADVFFRTSEAQWLTMQSLPSTKLDRFDNGQIGAADVVNDEYVPIIFGKPVADAPTPDYFPLDIFGSAFFMLSRYEEYVINAEDHHGRFPASESIAWRNGFLERPIVNEYLELLWTSLKRLWPNLKRSPRYFSVNATHDVDIPFEYLGQPVQKVFVKILSDLYHGKNFLNITKHFKKWHQVNQWNERDPYDTFDWIMNTLEGAGLKGTFNFMSGGSEPEDFNYSLASPHLSQLIRRIINREHTIGFHPSYNTFDNGLLWNKEYHLLCDTVKNHSIEGGRQHFLRFKVPLTWRFWDENGLDYDSTLGFPDHAGFRCGTCYPFTVYDLEQRKKLRIREKPLIVMDTTVIDSQYMGMGLTNDAVNYILNLKKACQSFRGEFNILWHNQRFTNPAEKILYSNVIF